MAFFNRHIKPDRKNFFNQLNIDESRVYSLYQKHTQHVIKIEKSKKPDTYLTIMGDGMVTAEKGIFLSITVGDCLPIFIINKKMNIYGIIHSGWKGTGIIINAIELSEKEYGIKRENLKIIIGPGIGSCCYNVPKERYALFKSRFGRSSCREKAGKYYIDLRKANLTLLASEGITDIDIIQTCTFCSPALHSFRRDGKDNYGLMMAIIGYFNTILKS